MTVKLPNPIQQYFQADKSSAKTVSLCFTENAVVKDEGNTHQGREAIRRWKELASAKYDYTCQPLSSEQQDGQVVVKSRLTGNFPGSPADLRFIFKLDGDLISSLEITS